jgi:hypothetical protein
LQTTTCEFALCGSLLQLSLTPPFLLTTATTTTNTQTLADLELMIESYLRTLRIHKTRYIFSIIFAPGSMLKTFSIYFIIPSNYHFKAILIFK